MLSQMNHNVGRYAHLILRRDRYRIPLWLISIALLSIIVGVAYTELVPTEQERVTMAETMRNPAITAMFGPGYGLDNYTIGAIMGHQMLLFTALAVAIMSILLVSRHTRGDEESGRIELIRSLPVGRISSLSATMIVMFGTNVVLALMVGLGLYGLGIDSMDLNGSLLYGAALGATGMVFAAITALFAQLSDNSRGVVGYSFAFLGVAYLVRAIGDVSNETLSWLSPLGWIVRTQVYVNNYWWPMVLTTIVAIGISFVSFYLYSIRDLGAGFIPSRPGRKHASPLLQSPVGLAGRLQRVPIIGWMVGMLVLGASYGSVLGDLETYLQAIEMIQEMLVGIEGFSLTEQFLPLLMAVMSMVGTIPALLMVLKLRGEEIHSRTEHLLARAVSRRQLMGSYLLLSVIVGFGALFLATLGLWGAGASVMDDPISFGLIFGAAMAYLPAVWIMTGLGVFLVGLFPHRVSLSWLYLAYSFFVVYLGALLQLPEWMAKLSPFGHVPNIPVEDFSLLAASIMTIVAVGLIAAGFSGFQRRDIYG